MYRLMIIDDDEILRKGLIKNINWEEHNIKVVAEAMNGKDALSKIELYMPEIILSDIRMPFMDGIELAKYIYENHPQIKILLLSAYEEFEYAKKALQYHVSDYIMKYESNEVILDRVNQLINQYEIDKKHKEIIEKNKDYIIKDFMQKICFNQLEENEIQQKIIENSFGFRLGSFSVLSIVLETYNSKGETRLLNVTNAKDYILSIRGYLKKYNFDSIEFQDKENIKLVINYNSDIEVEIDEFYRILNQMIYEIEKDHPIRILIGGGIFYRELFEMSKAYLEAEEALSTIKLLGKNNWNTKVILLGMTKNKHENMVDVMDKIVKFINENYADPELSLQSIAKQVYLSPNYISSLFKKYQDLNISNYIIDVRMKNAEKLLKETNLKAYEIANMVGYTNSQYFSILFKRTTGFSPSDYRESSR